MAEQPGPAVIRFYDASECGGMTFVRLSNVRFMTSRPELTERMQPVPQGNVFVTVHWKEAPRGREETTFELSADDWQTLLAAWSSAGPV